LIGVNVAGTVHGQVTIAMPGSESCPCRRGKQE
jgi:hypothetical protein